MPSSSKLGKKKSSNANVMTPMAGRLARDKIHHKVPNRNAVSTKQVAITTKFS